jgi:hypothetical protein
MKHLALVLAMAAAFSMVGACEGTSQEPATVYLDDLDSHLTAFKTSLAAHGTEIATATDVASMMAMESAHMMDAQAHMGDMSHDVDMMDMCTDAQGSMMHMADMGTAVQKMLDECMRHKGAMTQAADVNSAMMEEGHHQAAMAAMMDQMGTMRDQMMGGGTMMNGGMTAGMYMCAAPSTP